MYTGKDIRMRLFIAFTFILVMFSASNVNAIFYRYHEDNGQVSITNDYNSIPERYRSGATAISEQELENRVKAREKREAAGKRRPANSQAVAPARNYVAPSVSSDDNHPVIESASSKTVSSEQGWFARQLPVLKIIAIAVILMTVFVFVGRVVSRLAPRPLALVIRIALFAAIMVYLFNGYAEKVSGVFAKIQQEGNNAQKAVDTRSDKIEKQGE